VAVVFVLLSSVFTFSFSLSPASTTLLATRGGTTMSGKPVEEENGAAAGIALGAVTARKSPRGMCDALGRVNGGRVTSCVLPLPLRCDPPVDVAGLLACGRCGTSVVRAVTGDSGAAPGLARLSGGGVAQAPPASAEPLEAAATTSPVVSAVAVVVVVAVATTALLDDALQPRDGGTGVGGLEPPLTRCTVVREGWMGEPQDRATPPGGTEVEGGEAVADTPPELPPTADAFEADVHSVSPREDGAKDIL
jgi:hypothetical protein